MKQGNLNLGGILKSARERKGLTLRAAEKTTGISNAYLSQLESGKIQQPSPVNLHKLSELYEIPYSQVLRLAGYPVPTESKESRSGHESRLGDITDDEEDALVEYLDFMRSRKKRGKR